VYQQDAFLRQLVDKTSLCYNSTEERGNRQ
jgi:hypothetical protein